MSDHPIREAPDYTNAALVMLGVNALCLFVAVWALAGYAYVLLIAFVLNHGITLIAQRRS